MPDDRVPVEIPLDEGMEPGVQSVRAGKVYLSRNTRFSSGVLAGTVGRQPAPASTSDIPADEDPGAVSAVPRGNSVVAIGKTAAVAYRNVPDAFERQPSMSGSGTNAQSWAPMTVTDGGVLYAGRPNDSPILAEACVQNGVIVSAFTYLRQTSAGHGLGFNRELFCVLRCIDAETGESLIADVEIASAVTVFGGAQDGCAVIGAVPLTISGVDHVAIWWGEYDHGTTTWQVKYREVQTEADLVVGSAVTAYSTTKQGSKCAVTQRVEGASQYTYIARNRDSDDRAEVVRWDHVTGAAGWTTACGTAARTVHAYVVQRGTDIVWPIVDIAATATRVCMAFGNSANASSQVDYFRLSEAGTEQGQGIVHAVINAAILFYYVGITAGRQTSLGEHHDWVFSATPFDVTPGYFGNVTPTAHTIQAAVMTNAMVYGTISADHESVWHCSGSLLPFSAHHAGNDAQLKTYPVVPIIKAPRAYHATDNAGGYEGYSGVTFAAGEALQDPAIEICQFENAATSTGKLKPVCRVGVGRAIPTASLTQTLIFGRRPGKPLSHDGQTFCLAYIADRDTTTDAALNVRWAIVDAARPPSYVETQHGITYVGAGSVFTWDGDRMLESTPVTQPRIRLEQNATGIFKFGVGTYVANAILTFRDAAGNVHRSRPAPADASTTLAGSFCIDAFVEIPPATLDGAAMDLIDCEVYLSAVGSTVKTLVTDTSLGRPLAPYATANGEYAFHLDTQNTDTANTPAWWSGGERVPDCPPSMIDLEMVSDRMWGIAGEERVPWYTKWAVPGRTVEWVASQTLAIPGPSRPTAVSQLDGRPLIFTKDDAWTVYGDGPNPNGVGSFTPPQRVAEVGAADPKLVLRTPQGVVFKSRSGWFILGPGAQLAPWGEAVRQLLDHDSTPATSMVMWRAHNEIRVCRGTGLPLVFNWEAQKWSYCDDASDAGYAVAGDDLYGLDGTAFTVDHDRGGSGSTAHPIAITTGWANPGGAEGDLSFHEVIYTAGRASLHGLKIEVYADYDVATIVQVKTWLDSEITAKEAGGRYTVAFDLKSKKHRALRFVITETGTAIGSASMSPLSLTVTVKKTPGILSRFVKK